MRHRRSLSAGLVLLLLSTKANTEAVLAQAGRSQFDGIYTDAQARRGQRLYDQHCAVCHGLQLEGVPRPVTYPGEAPKTPPLVGDEFIMNWAGLPVSELLTRIRISMPQGRPGALLPSEVADVLAFILSRGNYPSGAVELPADPRRSQAVLFLREFQ